MEIDLQRFYNVNRRVLMWIAFFGILYLLRHFFAVMFLTFIFGFVMRTVAKFLTSTTRLPYWGAVILPYLVVLTLLVMLMGTAIPHVLDQAVDFSYKVPGLLQSLASKVQVEARRYGLEPVLARYVNPPPQIPTSAPGDIPPTGPAGNTEFQATESLVLDQQALTRKIEDFALSLLRNSENIVGLDDVPYLLKDYVEGVVSGTMQFLLAILLSFLIVLDFEAIGAELRKWRESTVGRFFHEAAASVVEFSKVVGQAFQCQLIVALLNATITCAGMFFLQIEPLLLLTTIVFLCGLVPVLGVFISSVPIILIAINKFSIAHGLIALGMVVGVHLLEAYVFNPRIYAARFRLNPVIVLIILLIAHELAGIWGMLLGIPVTHYVLNIAQLPPRPRKKDRKRDQETAADTIG